MPLFSVLRFQTGKSTTISCVGRLSVDAVNMPCTWQTGHLTGAAFPARFLHWTAIIFISEKKELNQLVYELLCKQFQVAFGVDSLADLRKVDTVALRQADFDRQIFELQEEKRKLYESLVSGGIPLPKYKEQKEQISERLLEVQNTKAVVMARLEAEQEERQHQRQQMDISRMLTESDGLTSELVDLLIDKIYVYPDKRVDVEFKIRDSLAAHK